MNGPFLIQHSVGFISGFNASGSVVTSRLDHAQEFATLRDAQEFLIDHAGNGVMMDSVHILGRCDVQAKAA